MKNSVLDRLKSYFDEYFSDATKPTAKNLFLIVVSILVLDIFRSVRFAHRHVLSKLSGTSLMPITMRSKLTGWIMKPDGM